MKKAGMPRALAVLGAVTALGVLAGGGAIAGAAKGGDVAVLKAKANLEKEKLFFKGPKRVAKGQKLEVRVTTDPAEIGPHTFSLVKEKTLPETKQEMKSCFNKGICGAIASWHEIEFPKEKDAEPIINRPKVFAGKKGWDKLGSLKRKGDSIFLENKGDSFTQKVSAKKGSKLFFICAIHPEMQHKIKVKG